MIDWQGLMKLLEKMLPRVSDRTANKAFWTILRVAVRLVYFSACMYWLIRLIDTLHLIGKI